MRHVLNVIGISALYHDSACCLIQDGKLVAAAEEERFTKEKHDARIPIRAFKYCLEVAGIGIDEVDVIGFYENPQKKLSRQLAMMTVAGGASVAPDVDANTRLKFKSPEWEIRRTLGFNGPIEYFDHHLSHAASSFMFSGFRDAAILTVDGVGEWATMTLGRGLNDDLEIIEETEFPHSIGLFYSALTSYLGFSVNDAEYKVMGLAPYGEPKYVEAIGKMIEVSDDGTFRLALEYFDFAGGVRMFTAKLVEALGRPERVPESEIEQFHKDVARSLQVVLEETLLKICHHLHSIAPSRNLCMAGGVALNCVANGRILREGPFERLFVQPAASDAGSALGAAALAYKKLAGRRHSLKPLKHVYLGPEFSSLQVASFLRRENIEARSYRGKRDEFLDEVADRLANQKVIGWLHGRMEFGPRALGARSILADPRNPEMRDRINALVKMREAFRPFAPSVLEEKAGEHFHLDHPSPYMLETCQVNSRFDLPAITHVDGSARVQTVNAKQNPVYAALIQRFEKLTGCPILLNTSFNLRGEPIVLDPFDAFWCFVRSDIDTLVLQDSIVDRENIPSAWLTVRRWPASLESATERNREVESHSHRHFYSFF